jgi:nucleotide-binding universal stress UspA family protein
MKILLAVDESASSEAAADYVRHAAWPPGAEVTLLSVAEPPRGTTAEVWGGPVPYLEQVLQAERELRRQLVDRVAERLDGGSYHLTKMLAEGDARSAIVDTAERLGADLVVVGSHGRTGLARLVMGSVASYVVAHSPCTVTVVKVPKRK